MVKWGIFFLGDKEVMLARFRSMIFGSSFRSYIGLILVFFMAWYFSPVVKGWPIFLQLDNLLDIVNYVSVRGVLAVGMTFVIISGGIDLSVGSVLSVSTVVCALSFTNWHLGAASAILLSLAAGCAAGLFNGVFTAIGRIQPFVITLAMMSIARGAAMQLSHNYTIPISGSQSAFLTLEGMFFGFLPVSAVIFILTVIVFQILLAYTSFGRNLYAIGGNETAARLAGVSVDRAKIITYVLCGALAAAAGLLQAAKMHQGDPKEGVAYELDAIAMVVVGGANLMGGRGTVTGTLVGALLIGMIVNILGLRNVEPSVQKIVIGALLVFAVAIQTGTIQRTGSRIMKTLRGFRSIGFLGLSLMLLASIGGCTSKQETAKAKFVIGFSQCNNAEPWRQAMNDAAKAEAAKHPEIELRFQDAEQKNDLQVNQVGLLLRQGIDLLIISPNEASPLTPVVEEVYKGGIPVVILDRAILSDSYTCFIGADNREIGKRAGEYIAKILDGKGLMVEIKGLPGSPPAIERSEGFREAIKDFPEIKIVHEPVADWLKSKAVDLMKTALQANPQIDLVYGHNDPMALGAYLAAKQVGREKEMKFIGIDALWHEGVKAVLDGELDATFWYPTCGKEAIEYALKILNGEKVEKTIKLPTALITKENAQEWMDKLKGSAS
ncbi:MAG: substrate-binding domain-containing protein [Candidatus Omnitrophota bacterium]